MTLLHHGQSSPPLGTWVKLPGSESVEILAYAGFDFVVIDLEHTTLDLHSASTHIATALALGMDPLVRVPDHGHSTIQRVLDAGASGVVVPHIDSAEQAQAVVRSTRFPPQGNRGSGGTSRAGRWGMLPRADYLKHGNEQALCIVQLESREAVDNASDILAVDGVDHAFLGTADLSMSMGADVHDKLVQGLVDSAITAAAIADRPIGTAAATSDQARAALARGFAYVVVSNDTSILAGGALSTVRAVRESAVKDVSI